MSTFSPLHKRLALLLTLLVMTTVGAHSQLLWRVTGNGAIGASYLFGTHHVAPAAMVDSIPGLPQAIASVGQMMVEIENDELTSAESQQKIAKHALAPADSVLTELYTDDELAKIRHVASAFIPLPLTFETMTFMKPVILSTLIQTTVSARNFPDYDSELQIDAAVQKRFAERDLPVYSLETVDEQIAFLFDTPIRMQADELLDICLNILEYVDTTQRMAELYRQQDLDGLWQLMISEDGGEYNPTDLDRLIFNRNRHWVDRLVCELPLRTTLVSVGAGHLPGEQGLINLLRQRGYTVEPVTTTNNL